MSQSTVKINESVAQNLVFSKAFYLNLSQFSLAHLYYKQILITYIIKKYYHLFTCIKSYVHLGSKWLFEERSSHPTIKVNIAWYTDGPKTKQDSGVSIYAYKRGIKP